VNLRSKNWWLVAFAWVPLVGCANSTLEEGPPPAMPQGGSASGSAGAPGSGSGGVAAGGTSPLGGRAGSAGSGGRAGGSGGAVDAGASGLAGAGGSAGTVAGGGSGGGGNGGRGGKGGGSGEGGGPSGGAGAGTAGGGAAGASGSAGTSAGASTGFPYELEFVGNITTSDGVDAEGKTYSRHWDQITPENAGKWGSVQSNAGAAFNWRTLDAIYDYTEQAGITFKQHAFVWGSQQPSGSLSEADVKEWMTEFCRRYPNTKLIDVVNEPPPHTTPSYANAIGGGTNGSWQWIINSFIWAREACPNAILILNDYSNIEYQADADRFIDIVKVIQAAGAPIDAVGAQAHDLDDAGMELSTVQGFVERLYEETGLPLYITEMDIDQTDDQAQLRYYQDYFPWFRDSGYVKGLTIWGWIYGRTWSVAPNSGLVRNGQSRSAMTWLMEELGRPIP
jgi:endo-1,4-beta-xylanase